MNPELEAAVGRRLRRIYEMNMALAILGLGVLFILNGRMFEPGTALEPMASMLPGLVWSLAFVMLGTARLVTLIVNGFWPLGPAVRWWLSAASLVTAWLPIAAAYWLMLPELSAFPTLVLGPFAVIGEASCLFALSALRAGQSGEIRP